MATTITKRIIRRDDHLVLHYLLLVLMRMAHNCKFLFWKQFFVTDKALLIHVLYGKRFHADPSGTFMSYNAKAIGSGSEGAQTELQDNWHKVSYDKMQTYNVTSSSPPCIDSCISLLPSPSSCRRQRNFHSRS
jgi:Proteasome subunit